ncbi:MAG: hypothetical protein WAM39_08255, partial [Bryobacteraceae bacterium]
QFVGLTTLRNFAHRQFMDRDTLLGQCAKHCIPEPAVHVVILNRDDNATNSAANLINASRSIGWMLNKSMIETARPSCRNSS